MFNYENTDTTILGGGKKVVRKVSIKNGKGYKSVTKYHNGKKVGSIKKSIHKKHVMHIHSRKFIPGLFSDCHCKKTRKHK